MSMDEKILDIIDRHIGEKLFVVYVMDDSLKCRFGKLTETYESKFTLFDLASEKPIKINYFKDAGNYTVALYNHNSVDLLKARTPMNLKGKLGLSNASENIIPRFRGARDMPVSIVTYELGVFGLINGNIQDIGMSDVIISLGKNSSMTDRIPFSKIIHIFDESCNDILSLKDTKPKRITEQ